MNPSTQAKLTWRKASMCATGSTCVEIAGLPEGGAAMRDGKDAASPVLSFDTEGWAAFLTAVRLGEFDAADR
jgi:hypothetical protein